jgi:hypothetical protein
MKRILTSFLLFLFIQTFICPASRAEDFSKRFDVNVVQITKKEAKNKELDKRLYSKFNTIMVSIKNNSNDPIFLLGTGEFKNDKTSLNLINKDTIFEKVKTKTLKRVVIFTLATFGVFIFFTPVYIVVSSTSNTKLEANLDKFIFQKHCIFPNDTFVTFIMMPKKYNEVKEITLNFSTLSDDKFVITKSLKEELKGNKL